MTNELYRRVRNYQQILDAWAAVNTVLNADADVKEPKLLVDGSNQIWEWLAKEQAYFERVIK